MQDRRDQEQSEQTRRFLEGGIPLANVEEVIKDSESGVGMMCSSPINHTDGVQEKKMGKLSRQGRSLPGGTRCVENASYRAGLGNITCQGPSG
jgi:hypothetical protein